MVLCLTAGTAMVMWMAELITQRGVGQGMSLLIFANVVAGIPTGLHAVLIAGGWLKCSVLIAVSFGLLGLHHLHGPGPAADPRHVRPTHGRAAG